MELIFQDTKAKLIGPHFSMKPTQRFHLFTVKPQKAFLLLMPNTRQTEASCANTIKHLASTISLGQSWMQNHKQSTF